jgi:hypothetical protein
MAAWCKSWNIKINEDKTRAIYFTLRNRPPDSLLTLNVQNIQFVNSVKYLCVIFDKRMTWRIHIEMIEAKDLKAFIRIYSLFKSERLSANIKLTLHKALIRSVMTYACPAWEFEAESQLLKLQRLQNRVFRTIENFPRSIRQTRPLVREGRPWRDCAGEDQQQQYITEPSSRQRGRNKITSPQLPK